MTLKAGFTDEQKNQLNAVGNVSIGGFLSFYEKYYKDDFSNFDDCYMNGLCDNERHLLTFFKQIQNLLPGSSNETPLESIIHWIKDADEDDKSKLFGELLLEKFNSDIKKAGEGDAAHHGVPSQIEPIVVSSMKLTILAACFYYFPELAIDALKEKDIIGLCFNWGGEYSFWSDLYPLLWRINKWNPS